jgi:hypothetical protein
MQRVLELVAPAEKFGLKRSRKKIGRNEYRSFRPASHVGDES